MYDRKLVTKTSRSTPELKDFCFLDKWQLRVFRPKTWVEVLHQPTIHLTDSTKVRFIISAIPFCCGVLGIVNWRLSLKQGMGNRGIRESGNRRIGESGNRGIRETGNPGIIETKFKKLKSITASNYCKIRNRFGR